MNKISNQNKLNCQKYQNILLLVPPVLEGEPLNYWISPPLGLLYIASYIEKKGCHVRVKKGYHVRVKDCTIENWNLNQLQQYLNERQPDLIGITCMINTIKH